MAAAPRWQYTDLPKRLKSIAAFVCLSASIVTFPIFFRDEFGRTLLSLALFAAGCILFAWAFWHPQAQAFRVLGPLATWELIRVARRERLTLWRTLYGLGLLLTVYTVYAAFFESYTAGIGADDIPDRRRTATLALIVFVSLAAVQFIVAAMLTPTLVVSTLADEREKATLDFLLITDLHTQEIILGKFVGRTFAILAMLAMALPIFGLLPFLGGVDPVFIVATGAATLATVLSLSSLTMYFALVINKPTQAGTQAVGLYFFYSFMVPSIVMQFLMWAPGLARFPTQFIASFPYTVTDLVNVLSAGSLQYAIGSTAMGGSIDRLITEGAGNYVRFHLILTLAALLGCMANLRSANTKPSETKVVRGNAPRTHSRPAPFDWAPVTWAEMYCHGQTPRNRYARGTVQFLYLASFIPIPAGTVYALLRGATFNDISIGVNVYMRFAVSMGLAMVVLFVTTVAARSVARERERGTLAELFLSALTPTNIVQQKWLGSLLAVRWGLLWLAIHWLIGVVLGAISLLALPVVVLNAALCMLLGASLGVFCSVTIHKTRNAIARAHGLYVLGVLAPFLVLVGLFCCLTYNAAARGSESWAMLFVGMSPAASYPMLNFRTEELSMFFSGRQLEFGILFVAGLVVQWAVYSAAAWLFLLSACGNLSRQRRVQAETGIEL